VCTQWQSGFETGNRSTAGVKGNRQNGDVLVPSGENLPDLRRKIYSECCHPDIVAYYRQEKRIIVSLSCRY
jgi:hypothetical protein